MVDLYHGLSVPVEGLRSPAPVLIASLKEASSFGWAATTKPRVHLQQGSGLGSFDQRQSAYFTSSQCQSQQMIQAPTIASHALSNEVDNLELEDTRLIAQCPPAL